MATLIFVDKENGEPGSGAALRPGLKLGSGPPLEGRAQVSGRILAKYLVLLSKIARKALGTANGATEKTVKTNGPLQRKQPSFSTKKRVETGKPKGLFLPSMTPTQEQNTSFPPIL
uniref:Securin n=1 Tax=Sciurus vulgaris TaxID=55149 RepID=A0A8D2E161_SCIVU